jgi:hypothetical protein
MADDKTREPAHDAASAVRSRRAATHTTTKPRSTTSGEAVANVEPRLSTADLGVTSDSIGAATLTGSFVAGHTASADYVIAPDDGYEAFYPRGAHQPSCTKLWSRGQQVHKTYYAEHGGASAATTPGDAKPINRPGGGIHETAGLTTAIR